MSDAASHNLKVSREGIVLIKSFEGFRPRAIQRAEGGWIIGYGHTLSAREGATVSEADAELLLRYDLLPVETSVNDTVPGQLNQHQFDALVSFAFSVGVDRFASSDVRRRLAAGAPGEAADAIMGWPEPARPDTALRRRAAERALFVANPSSPVALSDLLSAPLPPPPVPVVTSDVEPVAEAEPAPVEPTLDAEPLAVVEAEPETEALPPIDPRGAAVAALLGEPPARRVQNDAESAPIIPSFALPAAVQPPAPSNDNPPAEAVVEPAPAPEDTAPEPAVAEPAEPATDAPAPEPSSDVAMSPIEPAPIAEDAEDGAQTATTSVDAPTDEQAADAAAPEQPAPDAVAWSAARYAPYNLSMVGPLPGLEPAAPRAAQDSPAIDHGVVVIPAIQTEDATDTAAPDAEAPVEPLDIVDADVVAPAGGTTTAPEPETPEAVEIETVEPASETAPVATGAVSTIEERLAEVGQLTAIDPAPAADPEPAVPVEPMAYIAPAPVAELVLTPLDDTPEPAFSRPLWTPEERSEADGSENNLFGEDLTLTLGGSVMRHEMEFEAPARFDWKETAPFIFMGGVGLVSFGAAMAAFRRAAEQSGGSELTIIGWVLALIGLGCVGVSSINLYRKFGLPGGD